MAAPNYRQIILNRRRDLLILLNIFRVTVIIIFIATIYYLLLLIPEELAEVKNIVLVVSIVKDLIVVGLVFLVFIVIIPSFGRMDQYIYTRLLFSILITYILSLIGVDPSLLAGGDYIGYIIRSVTENAYSIVYGATLIALIISGILFIGFIRRGTLELLLVFLLVTYLMLIFSSLFTQFSFSNSETLTNFFTVKGIIDFLSSSHMIFFILTFVLVEVGQVFSFVCMYTIPLSDRFNRIVRQMERIERVTRVEEKKIETSLVGSPGEKRFLEVISPLAKSIIRDAYEGYAFLGEGTSFFVSAKLKAYTDAMTKKDQNFMLRIAGLFAAPGIASIIVSLVVLMLVKIIGGIVVILMALYLLTYILGKIGEGQIVEMSRIEAYIFANFAVLALMYVLIVILGVRLKMRRLRAIKEIS